MLNVSEPLLILLKNVKYVALEITSMYAALVHCGPNRIHKST